MVVSILYGVPLDSIGYKMNESFKGVSKLSRVGPHRANKIM